MDGGIGALAFNSGSAAAVALLATLPAGARVVAPRIMYHGIQDWLRRLSARGDIELAFFDETSPGSLAEVVAAAGTELVWIESPVNPTWTVIDIAAAADIAHHGGATLVVDSTVAPPVTTRPLDLGADVVFHSATKYYNGHSDVTAGLLVTAAADDRWQDVAAIRTAQGGILAPFESWLLLRGMKTMPLRYARSSATAATLARHFEEHPALEAVFYPGLENHPGHAIAARQMTGGFGGMISLLVTGGMTQAKRVAARTEIFTQATSLGGVESLIEHRATVEGPHSSVPDNLVRLSIGLEDPADLIADLETALS